MGAWIEIDETVDAEIAKSVAPHVGAWIEIQCESFGAMRYIVAPHVGAWIEMSQILQFLCQGEGRTPRGCVD